MAATSISSSAMPTRAVLVCTDATTTSTRMQSRADGSIVICTIQRWIYGSMDLESRASEPRDSATGAVPSVKKTNQHSSHVARGSVHDAFRRLWRGRRGTVVGAVHAAGQAERPHVRLAFLLQLNSARGARTLGSKKASAPLFLAEGPPGRRLGRARYGGRGRGGYGARSPGGSRSRGAARTWAWLRCRCCVAWTSCRWRRSRLLSRALSPLALPDLTRCRIVARRLVVQMAITATVCMWLMWLVVYMHQVNPIVRPERSIAQTEE